MKQGLRGVAQRSLIAEENFVRTLMEMGSITKVQAEIVFNVYRKLKLVKRDVVNAVYTVKHGAYLDRDVIRRALEQGRK